MLDEAVSYLRCPQCAAEQGLARDGRTIRCAAGHSFDIAKAGYVNLLPAGPPKNAGDSAAMVRARQDFLAAGHFAALAANVAELAQSAVSDSGQAGCVAEVGAGTGYYLAAILDRLPDRVGLALDISKNALRVAARAHSRIAAIGCDAWRALPVMTGGADLVFNVFAPREGAELRRILRPDGHLIVCTPAADHLAELIEPLGMLAVDERKQERLGRKLGPNFDRVAALEHRETLRLDHVAVRALAAMGPGSWHTDPAALAATVAALPEPVPVTVAVTMTSYRPTRR